MVLIFLGSFAVMNESIVWEDEWLLTTQRVLVLAAELATTLLFCTEYAIRLWACRAGPTFDQRHPRQSRLRFALLPASLCDAIFILPFFFLLSYGADAYFDPVPERGVMDVLRIVRGMRLVKYGRYSPSMQVLTEVIKQKSDELVSTAMSERAAPAPRTVAMENLTPG